MISTSYSPGGFVEIQTINKRILKGGQKHEGIIYRGNRHH